MANEKRTIESLIEYISNHQTDFRQKIVGADPNKVAELDAVVQELMGFSLPTDYKDFLLAMGGDDTPFSFTFDADSTLSEVLEKTIILLEEEDEDFPPKSVLIAVYGFQVDELATEYLIQPDDTNIGGRVFTPNGKNIGDIFADDFVGFLYNQAFKNVVGADLPFVGTLFGTELEPNLTKIERVCNEFGIEKHWFSDSVNLSASDRSEYKTLVAFQKKGQYSWVRVAGRDRDEINKLADVLKAEADLRLERWWS